MTYSARRERYAQNVESRIQAIRKLRRKSDGAGTELTAEILKEMRRACDSPVSS